MEFKLKIDEARVLKLATDGYGTKQIEEEIAKELRAEAKRRALQKVSGQVGLLISNFGEDEFKKNFVKQAQDDLKKVLTPKNIAKQFKKEEWEKLFQEVVEPVMTDFIEYALSEWLQLSIEVKGGKKVSEKVELCGTDSYTHRKK